MRFTLQERLHRLSRWYRRENIRPLLGFFLESMYPLHRYTGSSRHLKEGLVQPEDVVVDDYLDDVKRLFLLHEDAGGDLIWSAAPFFGLPWVEASLGCPVVANFATGSIRSLPPEGFRSHEQIPEFSEDNLWIRKMLEFIPVLLETSEGRYPVGVTLMRGISDLLSALYGGETFIYKMMEDPMDVQRTVEKLTEYWTHFGHCLLDHLPMFHNGTGAFFYCMWCPGKTIWMQEDAAALLSPAMYEKFIDSANRHISSSFEHSVIHLHPSSFIPVDYVVNTKIDVIELHIDKGGPTAQQLFAIHRKIIEKKPLFVYGNVSLEDMEFMLENLPHPGLAINMAVDSVQVARQIWRRFEEIVAGENKGVTNL